MPLHEHRHAEVAGDEPGRHDRHGGVERLRIVDCGLRISTQSASSIRNSQSEIRTQPYTTHPLPRSNPMTLSTATLLAPQTIKKAISQFDLAGTSLQTLF